MYRSFLLASTLAATLAHAQTTVHQVIVLNEGRYDYANSVQAVPVTLGTYDPVAQTYQQVATIPNARFGNHVLVDAGVIYVGADSLLLAYDADTYGLLDQTVVKGIRRFAIWNNEIICTQGDFGVLPHFVEVLDKSTLDLLYSVPTADLPYSCDGVAVVGDKAYLAVNNAFDINNMVGQVGVLDLATQTYESTIDLGPDGLNPEHLMVDNGAIYSFNNKDFSGSSVSKISVGDGTVAYTDNVAQASSCAASAMSVSGHIYFLEYAVGKVARFNVNTAAVEDTLAGSPNAYGLLDDPINNVMYVTTTDYVSTGDLYVMTHDGTVLNTMPVSVSPGRMALDVRTATSVQEPVENAIRLFPNPATDALFVQLPVTSGSQRFTVIDASGRVVMDRTQAASTTQRLDVHALAAGLYTLRVEGLGTARFAVH